MQLVFLRLCPTCLFLRLILSVSFPVINHNSEDSSFQWLLLSSWIWGSLNLQLVLEVSLIMWTVCPPTGELALILGTVPFASWLFRSSLGPISTSLLTERIGFHSFEGCLLFRLQISERKDWEFSVVLEDFRPIVGVTIGTLTTPVPLTVEWLHMGNNLPLCCLTDPMTG